MNKTKVSNNPAGRPTLDGPTEMVSKRIPVELMDKVRLQGNATQFIIDAIKEKLDRLNN